MRHHLILSCTTLLAIAVVAGGCGPDPEPEYPDNAYQGGYGAQAPTTQGGYGAQTPVPTATTTVPTTAGTATAISPMLTVMASPILKEMAAKETAGMHAEGPVIAAQFQDGQYFEHPFQVQPGKCYAVVGVGIGISELDFELVLQQPPAPEWVAAVDQTKGPQAVLGGNGKCVKNPFPIGAPAKLRIRASGGNGAVAAQIYSR